MSSDKLPEAPHPLLFFSKQTLNFTLQNQRSNSQANLGGKMKLSVAAVLFAFATASLSAHASQKTIELGPGCEANVNQAIADTYDNEDDNGCVTGASIDEINSLNGDKLEVTYGRHVCEGYITGTAAVTLAKTKKITSSDKITIDECDVTNVEILEESGD
jgi:hypothetical protein